MRCNRCGAHVADDAQKCARCGNTLVVEPIQKDSLRGDATPQDPSAPLPEPELVDPVVVIADQDSPAPSPDVQSSPSDLVSPVSSTTSAPATQATSASMPAAPVSPVSSAASTASNSSPAVAAAPAATVAAPACAPAAARPSSTVHSSPASSATIQMPTAHEAKFRQQAASPAFSLTSWIAAHKRFSAVILGICVLAAVCAGVGMYTANRVAEGDMRTILNASPIMQQGLVSSQYTEDSTYHVNTLSIQDQHELAPAELSKLGISVHTPQQSLRKVNIDAKIANDSIESSFKATMYLVKVAGKWTSISEPQIDTNTLESKPLKGVSARALGKRLRDVDASADGDLQHGAHGYTSTVSTTEHKNMWYGTIQITHPYRFVFDNKTGWNISDDKDNKDIVHIAWQIQGKTYVKYDPHNLLSANEDATIVVNDVNDKTADISYTITSDQHPGSPGSAPVKLSGRHAAHVKLENEERLYFILKDPDNGVTLTISDSGLYGFVPGSPSQAFSVYIDVDASASGLPSSIYHRHMTLEQKN